MEQFGKKLHALRKFHRLTLKQLALTLGYATHSYLSELEAGVKMPTVDFVLKVSEFFGVTTDELLKDEIEVNCLASYPAEEK